jgi:NTE family protein
MNSVTTLRPRPRLALVLGSGGVRSAAALGIAEVLAREGLSPNVIVGCSSGALFGALLAMDLPTRTRLDMVTKFWSADLTQKRRWASYLQLVAPKLLGFDAGFSLRDARMIARRIEDGFGNRLIESLPVPLRIVTTETATGDSVVLTHGRLTDALRASMALPFLFPSVEIAGRRLADGVIADPLPVSAAHDCDAIVTLGFRGVMPRRIDRPSRLLAQVSTAMINNLQKAHIRAAEAAGQRVLNIELALDRRIGLWETAAMPRIFEAGRSAAERYLPEIRAMLGCVGGQVAA